MKLLSTPLREVENAKGNAKAPPKPPVVTKPVVEESPDEAGDAGEEYPDDPEQLKAMVTRLRAKVRRGEKKLEDAGLTKTEEKRLTTEIALMSSQLNVMKAKLDTLVGDDEPSDDADDKTDEAPAGDTSKPKEASGWKLTLLG